MEGIGEGQRTAPHVSLTWVNTRQERVPESLLDRFYANPTMFRVECREYRAGGDDCIGVWLASITDVQTNCGALRDLHYYMYGEYAEYSRLLGMDGRLLNPEGYADYVSGRGFCIGQMGSKGREVSLQDLLGPGSIQSKLAALCSTFHGPGWLSYCILGARRWLGQLLPLVGDLLLPPTGKHGSLNALPVWFIGAMAASVSADHVTPRDSATSGVANGEATASYCHHKWGCFEFTLAVFTVGVVLFGVCCRSSLRACAQRVRQRARASSDIGAVLPTRAAPDARSMFFCGMSFWGIVVHGER